MRLLLLATGPAEAVTTDILARLSDLSLIGDNT
jgi:hypothetical protein